MPRRSTGHWQPASAPAARYANGCRNLPGQALTPRNCVATDTTLVAAKYRLEFGGAHARTGCRCPNRENSRSRSRAMWPQIQPPPPVARPAEGHPRCLSHSFAIRVNRWQNAASESLSPTGRKRAEAGCAPCSQPGRSPLWANTWVWPPSSRMNGWVLRNAVSPKVASRMCEITRALGGHDPRDNAPDRSRSRPRARATAARHALHKTPRPTRHGAALGSAAPGQSLQRETDRGGYPAAHRKQFTHCPVPVPGRCVCIQYRAPRLRLCRPRSVQGAPQGHLRQQLATTARPARLNHR